jgi:DNA repair protein RadC
MTKHAHDNPAAYRLVLTDEEAVLTAAEAILRRRLERLGCITDPTKASEFLRMRLAKLEHEEFHVMFLDNRHRILACTMQSRGTIDQAEVHPREVLKSALAHNAAAVILAHNHPSGCTEPSMADRALTLRLRDALALVEIRVLDHIIVGAEGTTSLAARGWV